MKTLSKSCNYAEFVGKKVYYAVYPKNGSMNSVTICRADRNGKNAKELCSYAADSETTVIKVKKYTSSWCKITYKQDGKTVTKKLYYDTGTSNTDQEDTLYDEQEQEFLAKDMEDFDGYTVINYDEDDTTNYAVLAQDTVTVEATETAVSLQPDTEDALEDTDDSNQDTTIPEDIPADAVEYNGHSYMLYDVSLTWQEAEAACEILGGHLATVTSAEENAVIIELIQTGSKYYWLDAIDTGEEGVWKWITGEDWSYENWISGQPDDSSDTDSAAEYYLTVERAKAGWNDLQAGGDSSGNNTLENSGYICEWDS